MLVRFSRISHHSLIWCTLVTLLVVNLFPVVQAYDTISFTNETARLGFFFGIPAPFAENSIAEVDAANGALNYVSPDWFGLDWNGNLVVYYQAYDKNVIVEQVEQFHARGIKVVPYLSNSFSYDLGCIAMANRDQLTDEIAAAIQEYNLDGMNYDIENLGPDEKDMQTDFMQLLRDKLPDKHLSISVVANPYHWTGGWHGSYDMAALANICDNVVLMSYDLMLYSRPVDSFAAAIAGEDAVKLCIDDLLSRGVPPNKLLMGIPFYGRIWYDGPLIAGTPPTETQQLLSGSDGVALGELQINRILADGITEIKHRFDPITQSDVTSFKVAANTQVPLTWGMKLDPGYYSIYHESLESYSSKMRLIMQEYHLAGYAAWAVGQEDPAFWAALGGRSSYVTAFSPVDVLGQVNDEVTLSAVVTNSAGIPVNTTVVKWEAFVPGTNYAAPAAAFKLWDSTNKVFAAAPVNTVTVSGQTSAMANGTYSQLVKLAKYADVKITVLNDSGTPIFYSYSAAKIYGAQVYTLDPITNLVAAKSQTFNIVMKDANGVAVKPTFIAIDDTAAPGILSAAPTFSSYDGTTGKVTVTPTKTGTFKLLVGTALGDKIAIADVTVVAPVVTVTVNGVESTKVTAGIRDKVVMTFADSAASIIDTTPVITASTLNGAIYTVAAAGTAEAGTATEPTVSGIVTIYPEYSIYKTAAEGSLAIKASFNNGTDWVTVATLEVLQPTLSFGSVKEIVIGSVVNLNLTLTDANNKPLKAYEIKASGDATFAGNASVTTDANGKAVLTVSPTAVGKLTLEVQSLKSVYDSTLTAPAAVNYTAALPIVRDTTGPVVTMDPVYTVSTLPATISFTVKDSSNKVTEVLVGDSKALLRPDGTVIFTVSNLSDGMNTFNVLAYDSYNNVTAAVLTVEYLKPPVTVVLTIGSLDATKDGAPMSGMDQAPVIVNGRTFLPVRFVLENLLGGTCNWDPATMTITSVVNGHNIQMVIGSQIAVVDGVNVALLEAPFIEPITWRTVVPMREIMEAIGCQLDWNAVTQTVTLIIPQ